MGQYLLMPKLDMSMKEGTIVTFLVNIGDEIKKGENVFEVETGKVSIEVDNTVSSGKILGIYCAEGDTVSVNAPVMYIGGEGENAPDKSEAEEYYRQLKKENTAFSEPHGYDYDVLIIGSGQAGYTFALHAAKYTEKIAVIEKGSFGGVCLNRGCIPSRFFYKRAESLMNISSLTDYDITATAEKFDYALSVRKKDELVKKLRTSMKHALMSSCDVYEADARIIAPNIVKVGEDMISAKYIIISSGSQPVGCGIPSDDSVKILTTEDVMCLEKLPEKAVLCGESEYIIEQAMMLHAFGVDVTLLSKVNVTSDSYLDKQIKKGITKKGVPVKDGEAVCIEKNHVVLQGGERIPADIFVYENTRRANVIPSEITFEFTPEGFYAVNDGYMTSIPGIYAIGDSNGLSLTAQGAGSDAQELAGIIFEGKSPERRVYPKCINVYPKVAYVGYKESDLDRLGIGYAVAKRNFASHTAAMASSSSGFVKLICDDIYGEILGFQIVAEDADDVIGIISLAMKNELTADELAKNIFVHPSLGEIITTVASEIAGKTGGK